MKHLLTISYISGFALNAWYVKEDYDSPLLREVAKGSRQINRRLQFTAGYKIPEDTKGPQARDKEVNG